MDSVDFPKFKFGYILLPKNLKGLGILSADPEKDFKEGLIQGGFIYPYMRMDELMTYSNFILLYLIVRDKDEKTAVVCVNITPDGLQSVEDMTDDNMIKYTELMMRGLSISGKYYLCSDDQHNHIGVVWNDYCVAHHISTNTAILSKGSGNERIELGEYDVNSQYQRLIDESKSKPLLKNPKEIFDKICFVCLKAGKNKACGNCKNNRYCSAECQKADWPNHKQYCKK